MLSAIDRREAVTLAAATFAVVIWSSAFAAIAYGLRAFSPAELSLLRFSIASVILIAFVLLVPKGLVPTLGDLGQWLLTAFGRRSKTRLEPKQAEEG